MSSSDKKFTLWVRYWREHNTDPLNQYYNGAFFSSEWAWTPWVGILDYTNEVDAKDTMKTFQRANPKGREYQVLPIMSTPIMK